MTRARRVTLVGVGALAVGIGACAAGSDQDRSDINGPSAGEDGTGATSAAVNGSSFAILDVTAICTLAQTCCGPLGYTINTGVCRNLFTSLSGFQNELQDSFLIAGGPAAQVGFNATTGAACLNGIPLIGCGNISAASYKATHQACMNAANGLRAIGASCTGTVQCANGYCGGGICTPLRAVGQPCTSSAQCSYRGKAEGCDAATGTCVALRPNGDSCVSAGECASGLCDGTCASTAPTVFDAPNCAAFGGTLGPGFFFDSLTGPASPNVLSSGSCGTLISVSTNQTVSRIGVRHDPTGSQSDAGFRLTFFIFNHSNHALLYASPAIQFADDGDTWKISNAVNFTLVAGQQYDIGAVSNRLGTWPIDTVAESQNGITSLQSAPRFTQSQTVSGHVAGDCGIRLY